MARNASHAGSWYKADARELGDELDKYLRAANLDKRSNARAVIAPHAGYRYSGRCAAFAFGNIDPTTISRVFILGPSHYHFTRKCALSRVSVYETPLGNLPIDLESEHHGSTTGAQHFQDHGNCMASPENEYYRKRLYETYCEKSPIGCVYQELKATGKFEEMDINVDEAEHSMEMHLPYIAKVFEGTAIKIIPILVGSLSFESEAAYGKLLATYIDDPSNFFSVSSDFCHWGSRFNYTYYEKKHGPICKSIEALDQNGMNIIESGDPVAFRDYLQEFDNTICGQHPIGVFLNMLKHCSTKLQIKFLQYEQSSRCKQMGDSSVSYASAVATLATG